MESADFLALAYTTLAQAYGCGDYGEGTYNNCDTSDATSGSSVKTKSGQGQGGDTSVSPPGATSPESSETPPTVPSPDASQPSAQEQQQTTTGTSKIPNTVANQVAGTPWGILLPIILFLALLLAFLIYLWKRRHHGSDQVPPNGGFTPGPGI